MTETAASTLPKYIDSDELLAQLCAAIQDSEYLAMDTEFIRRSTYYAKLALIQVAVGDNAWLIDPLTITHWQPLQAILGNTSIVKVLHSGSEDLDIFQRYFGLVPSPMIDTQVAASFAGYGYHVGYANLVQQVLTVTLPKTETQSDWLKRPLTTQQQDYASNDVTWLGQLYLHFKAVLGQPNEDEPISDKWAMLQTESQSLANLAQNSTPADLLYLKVKGQDRLNDRERYLLQQMCIWRDEMAQDNDIPKGWVINDRHLQQLCQQILKRRISIKDLFQIKDYSVQSIKRYGKAVIDHLLKLSAGNATLPYLSVKTPQTKALVNQWSSLLTDIAATHSINEEILATRTDLLDLAYYKIQNNQSRPGVQSPKLLTGWRKGLVGQQLLDFDTKKPVLTEPTATEQVTAEATTIL